MGPIRVFLACSGLGAVRRGFESFTQECFDALRDDAALDLRLFKGQGQTAQREWALHNLPRGGKMAPILGRTVGRDAYFVEQFTFFLSLLPHLARARPRVVFFSDALLGKLLWRWRKHTGARFRLLFSNGEPAAPPFPFCDLVQQVAPCHYQAALDAGVPAAQMSVVPYGVRVSEQLQILSAAERRSRLERLNLPADRPVVLSVAAIDAGHKRMDELIREVAMLPAPRPFLLLLGQRQQESERVIALGRELLGDAGFDARTVPLTEVGEYYRIANVFALASFKEGLPRVLLEAMSYGVPCVAHDYDIARFALGAYGFLADLSKPGALARQVSTALRPEHLQPSARHLRHAEVRRRFAWESLRPQYIEMIRSCASGAVGSSRTGTRSGG